MRPQARPDNRAHTGLEASGTSEALGPRPHACVSVLSHSSAGRLAEYGMSLVNSARRAVRPRWQERQAWQTLGYPQLRLLPGGCGRHWGHWDQLEQEADAARAADLTALGHIGASMVIEAWNSMVTVQFRRNTGCDGFGIQQVHLFWAPSHGQAALVPSQVTDFLSPWPSVVRHISAPHLGRGAAAPGCPKLESSNREAGLHAVPAVCQGT